MRQIAITRYGNAQEAFQFEDQAEPQFNDAEILVKVEGFGLNYADVMARNGLYKDAPPLPFVPGYEIVGKVVKQGKDVPEQFNGKRVVSLTRFGGYAGWAVADYRAAAIVGDEVSGGVACALATQYCTAYYMTDYVTQMHAGEIALIHACAGGVGTAITQLCQRKGVKTVGLCSSDEKIAYLEKMGVDLPINYKKEDYKATIEAQFGKRRMDYIFNTVAGKSFKKDLKLLGFGGRIFCFGGAARSGKKNHIFNDLAFLLSTGFVSPLFMMMKSQGVIGVNMLRIADNKVEIIGKCLEELHSLLTQGEIKPTIGAVYPADKIAEAHDLLESGKSTGKIYVQW